MADKITTAKVIIDESHELTDLVREIHKSKAERIVLTFTEQTDLLISPINLRVLQEAAQREGKLLITQIIQNPTGIRNAKLAGMKVIDSPSAPTEYDWEEAAELVEKLKESKANKKKEEEIEIPQEENKEVFEERIKNSLEENGKKKYEDRRGVKSQSFIAIDGDLPPKVESGKNTPATNELDPLNPALNRKKKGFNFAVFQKFKGISKKSLLKLAIFGLIPLLLITFVGLFLYNQFATMAKVKIFVEAKPVEIEQVLTGKEGIEEIDFENLIIPIKVEEKTESLSDSISATGKAFRGEKAKGLVRFTFFYKESDCPDIDPPVVSLKVGHVVTTGEYTYKVTSAVDILCNQAADVSVEAAEIGEQYNIAAGKQFSVQGYTVGYSEGEVRGVNAAAFTGGSKEEYTVLSQQDVDNAVEQLTTTALEEVKSDLRESAKGWEIIEDTILSEVDKGSIKTDKKVGEEAATVNLDLTIKGSATYYLTTGLTEALTDLLRQKAEEDNLFESEKDLELVLGDEIETNLTVEDSEKDVVKIKIIAKSKVKPKVDKTEIENTLRGMDWEKGREYLNGLNYADRKYEVVFTPMNYPEFLKRFPDRRGGVMITVTEIEVEE